LKHRTSNNSGKLAVILKTGRLALLQVFFSVVLILPLPALAAQVTLTWEAIIDSRVQGYTVRYRPYGGNYTTVSVGNQTMYALPSLDYDTLYYFAVKANGSAAESPFCDEVPYRTPPDPKTCGYSLLSSSASHASSGGAGNVTVSAPAGCTWNSSTTSSWLNLTSGATGSGTGTVVYSVGLNTNANQRTASLTIAGQTFTVTQAGLPTYTITPSVTSSGGLIVPQGAVTVAGGATAVFSMVRFPGHTVANVIVDGVSVGAVPYYIFSTVNADHTISVSFTP
jgi:hypothetical protein